MYHQIIGSAVVGGGGGGGGDKVKKLDISVQVCTAHNLFAECTNKDPFAFCVANESSIVMAAGGLCSLVNNTPMPMKMEIFAHVLEIANDGGEVPRSPQTLIGSRLN